MPNDFNLITSKLEKKSERGIDFKNKKNFIEANKIFSELVIEHPNHFYPRYLLGELKIEMGDYSSALDHLLISLSFNNSNITTYINLSYIYTKLKDYKKTEDILLKGIDIDNKNLQLKLNLSLTYLAQGKMNELIKNDEEILKISPNNFYVIHRLYELNQPVLDQKLRSKLKKLLKKNKLDYEDKTYANFLLAKFENNEKKISLEYEYLMNAHDNIISNNERFFKSNNDFIFSKLKNIHEHFDKKINIKKLNLNTEQLKPIFIFGLPRSGSTILEKIILNSSSHIIACEETKLFNHIADTLFFNRFEEDITKCISHIHKEYLKLLNTTHLKTVFTDKSLNNFFFLGWIKLLFPGAKFINCNRNPYTIISSIIRNNLSNLTWAHQLDDIKNYIDTYYHVTQKWIDMHDLEIYQFYYNNLVQDFDLETKKIFDFCELPWNEKLKNFNDIEFVSHTASNIKVRENFSINENNKHQEMSNFLQKKLGIAWKTNFSF